MQNKLLQNLNFNNRYFFKKQIKFYQTNVSFLFKLSKLNIKKK